MKKMTIYLSIPFSFGMAVPAFAQATFPGGERDSVTPQVRLVEPVRRANAGEPIPIVLEYVDYDFQPTFVTNPMEEYASSGVIDGQVVNEIQLDGVGHFHVYVQELVNGGFTDVAVDESGAFCAINVFNPDTSFVVNDDGRSGTVFSTCPPVGRGRFRICAVAETHSHAQRIKAGPRDFPPVDCRDLRVSGRR
jgi:hypothetical protein